jgi:hypothetical protein
VGLLAGVLLATTIFGVGIYRKATEKTQSKLRADGIKTILPVLFIGAFLALATAAPAYAQATPVPLTIPTDVIFTESNNWISVFAPVAAIGIGISIALAVLGYLGKMIRSAFN